MKRARRTDAALIADVAQLDKGATAGPWRSIKPGHGHATSYRCVQLGPDRSYSTLELRPRDAALIVAYRRAAPELARRLGEMRELLDEADAVLDTILHLGVLNLVEHGITKPRAVALAERLREFSWRR